MMLALRIVETALGLFAVAWMFQQVRKPSGRFGQRVVRAMNIGHSTMTDWALGQLPIRKNDAILDVGCGGGRMIQKLAVMAPQGTVQGIDYSATSVAASQDTNAAEISAGRVKVQQASVAALPFPDKTFDIVTASETHYYWPDLPANVREVLRVVKPGGTFCLIAETHRNGFLGHLYWVPMFVLRAAHLNDAEFRELLTQAGFADVTTMHRPGRNWICATGRRPA